MKNQGLFWTACLMASIAMAGCVNDECTDETCTSEDYGVDPQFHVTRAALTVGCSIEVDGFGRVDIESDYVPNVTWCEHGHANDAALRAQAVAARTFAYYKLDKKNTPVDNSQGDQVYNCKSISSRTDAQFKRCLDATSDTADEVLTYNNTVTAGFFVAGSKEEYLDSTCRFNGNKNSTGWVSTQDYVTYNEGKTGDGIEQSTIGYLSKKNYANRGCMSQNGASCLGKKGYSYRDILKFFYGADIKIEKATGDCSTFHCSTVLDKSGVVIDDLDLCFTRWSGTKWYSLDGGYGGHLYYTYVTDKEVEYQGIWTVNVTQPGTYEVFAYIQSGVGAVSEKAPYVVRASGVEHKVNVNLSLQSGWVSIGKFQFAAGGDQWVKLTDMSGEPYTDKNGKRVVFDALKFVDAVGCSDNCVEGEKQCSGNAVQSCIRDSVSGCTVWSSQVTDCGSQTCLNGTCDDVPCENECRATGQRECSGGGYHVCGNFDADSCLEWSSVTSCESGKTCSAGVCMGTGCTDECHAAESECRGNGYVLCRDYDGDGCLEWGTNEIACESNETCRLGTCIKPNTGGSLGAPWSGEVGPMPSNCLTEVDGRPSTIIDDMDACFVRSQSISWSELIGYGYGVPSHLYYAYVTDGMPSAVGVWYLNVTKAGDYDLYTYVESGIGYISGQAPFTVKSAAGTDVYSIDLSNGAGWYHLGRYTFEPGEDQYVMLMDATGEEPEGDVRRRMVYDAIQVVPVGGKAPEGVIEDAGNSEEDDGPRIESGGCGTLPMGGRSGGFGLILLGGLMFLTMGRKKNQKIS